MKLSKKNAARQRAIHASLVAGKALGGLLAGVAAVALTSCRDERSPSRTMGLYPAPAQTENGTNERKGLPMMGDVKCPKDEPPDHQFMDCRFMDMDQAEEPASACANAARENPDKAAVMGKMLLVSPEPASQESGAAGEETTH